MRTFAFRHNSTSLTPAASASRLRSPEGSKTKQLLRKRTSASSLSQQEALPSLTGQPSSYVITITPAHSPDSPPQYKRGSSLDQGPGSHVIDTVKALEQAARLPKPSDALIAAAKISLPPPRRPQTIVFDLEETLAHICEHKASAQVLVNGGVLGFNIRPYAGECLFALRKHWEIIVFASSDQSKADPVLDFLDPSRTLIDHRLYRNQALLLQNVLVKDLRLLSGRDQRRTVIVENTASAFAFQLDSGVPIKTWRNRRQDTELLKLLEFLSHLLTDTDMRSTLRRTFDLVHLRDDFAKVFSLP